MNRKSAALVVAFVVSCSSGPTAEELEEARAKHEAEMRELEAEEEAERQAVREMVERFEAVDNWRVEELGVFPSAVELSRVLMSQQRPLLIEGFLMHVSDVYASDGAGTISGKCIVRLRTF